MEELETQFTVRLNELLAVRIFASGDDLRAALNTVRVELKSDRVLLIATDGRRLCIIRSECGFDAGRVAIAANIPVNLIDALKRGFVTGECEECGEGSRGVPDSIKVAVTIRSNGANDCLALKLELVGENLCVSGDACPLAFPDISKVIPQSNRSAQAIAAINFEMLKDFQDAIELMGYAGHIPHLIMRRSDEPFEILFAGVPQFYGLQMGMRSESEPIRQDWIPAWAGDANSWRPIATAPKNATWVMVKTKDGQELRAHWAQDTSGEDQPAFSGWFIERGLSMAGIEEPSAWKPI